jgi:hypothetical protein
MTVARVDSSRQRHQASETTGQTRATATAGIIAVKARSRGFPSQHFAVKRQLTSRFVVPCYPLLSPQMPLVRGPGAAPGAAESGWYSSRTCLMSRFLLAGWRGGQVRS